ncbi:MAG: substrate-binding domain-containing protein [Akkermansiaceae bacterium]
MKPHRIAIRIPAWVGYGRKIYRGIGNYMIENRLRWNVETELHADGELKPFKIDQNWEGDGAILFRYSDQEAKASRSSNRPLVCVSRLSQEPWVSRVHADNHMIGRMAAEHLIGTGTPNLVCWIDPKRDYALERLAGFSEVAEKHHREVIVLENTTSLYRSRSKWSDIGAAMQKQLKSLPLPAAIFARDDISAAGLMRSAEVLSLKIPEDLAVLGVGDDPVLNSVSAPSMSSVAMPATAIGWHAARLLHHQLENGIPKEAEVIELPVKEIIRRETTNHMHVQDDLVSHAAHLIKTKVGKKTLTVQQLCNMLGVSSTTLLKRFQASMDMSPKQLIDHTRHEEAARLLNQTSWPVKEVAYEMGFRSPEEFDRFFKRHAGISPGAFRTS